MSEYLTILGSVIPVFLLMGVGAVVRRRGVLNEDADRTFVNLLVHVLAPCLILDHVIPSESLRQWGNLFWSPVMGFVCMASGIVLAGWMARVWGIPAGAQRRTFAFVGGIFNYGYIPVPLIDVLYGSSTLGVLFVFNLGAEVAFWVVGFAGFEQRSVIKEWPRIFTSPVRAILLGVAINLTTAYFGLRLDSHAVGPGWAWWLVKIALDTIHMIGICSIPLAMLLIGATMADFWDEFRATKSAQVISLSLLVRNVIGPASFVLLAYLLPISRELKETVVVQAAMPAGVFTLLLTRHHGGDVPVALQIIFATSAASIVTLPLWIHFGMQIIGVK